MELTKKQFIFIIDLIKSLPWLNGKEEGLFELFEFCNNKREMDLISNLLMNFYYADSERVSRFLDGLVNYIEYLGTPNNTQIVSATYDDSADSAQAYLWKLKPYLGKRRLNNIKLVHKWPYVTNYLPKYNTVIIFDDFIGTGKTIIKRYKDARASIRGSGHDADIRIISIACMNDAYNRIKDEGIEIFSCIKLKKGIYHYYNGKYRKKMYCTMYKIESRLKQEIDGEIIPNMGNGRAEAIYNIDEGNIPNSVFPIFWWPITIDNIERKTLFYRHGL
jgi:hypothetical protein